MKLYKKDSNGKVRIWEISNIENTIVTTHGQLGGKLQESRDRISKGKGGRTVLEQVESVIESMVNKRIDNGYSKDLDKLSPNAKNSLGFYRPMLASKIDYEKISYGECFVQRKYDGHRCLITMQNGSVIAYSRGGKLIKSINHILDEIKLSGELKEGETLDGELYVHGLSLQDISGLVRTQKNQSVQLIFHCYDFVSEDSFKNRINIAHGKITRMKFSNITETIRVNNNSEIAKLYRKFKDEKYEGAIVRWSNQGYKDGKRVKFLMKVKEVIREEFKVIDIVPSKDGLARLICKCRGGEFKVFCHGSHIEKRAVLESKNQYIGEYITVEFACYTSGKKPSQPVAVSWREKGEF